jgi:hypothetical protein
VFFEFSLLFPLEQRKFAAGDDIAAAEAFGRFSADRPI